MHQAGLSENDGLSDARMRLQISGFFKEGPPLRWRVFSVAEEIVGITNFVY